MRGNWKLGGDGSRKAGKGARLPAIRGLRLARMHCLAVHGVTSSMLVEYRSDSRSRRPPAATDCAANGCDTRLTLFLFPLYIRASWRRTPPIRLGPVDYVWPPI
jgi:hypothetical protein